MFMAQYIAMFVAQYIAMFVAQYVRGLPCPRLLLLWSLLTSSLWSVCRLHDSYCKIFMDWPQTTKATKIICTNITFSLSLSMSLTVNEACADLDVRLTYRDTTGRSGQVEICNNNTWHKACSSTFSFNDGQTTCNQLFGPFTSTSGERIPHRVEPTSLASDTKTYFQDNLACSGNELSLRSCPPPFISEPPPFEPPPPVDSVLPPPVDSVEPPPPVDSLLPPPVDSVEPPPPPMESRKKRMISECGTQPTVTCPGE